MVLPYSQAQLLFISSPLKASEPFIGFLIKMCYLSLHSKVEKTGVGRGYLVALPMRLPGPPFPLHVPGLTPSAETLLCGYPFRRYLSKLSPGVSVSSLLDEEKKEH